MIEFHIHYPTCRETDKPSHDRVRVEFVLPKRPFLFWVSKRESEEMNLPKGYGVAWYDFARMRCLYAPMPLNTLIGLGIWLWKFTRYGWAFLLQKSLRPAKNSKQWKGDDRGEVTRAGKEVS